MKPQNNQPKKPQQVKLSDDELAKVLRSRARRENVAHKVSQEEFLVAEMGYYFGWSAVEAVLYDERLTLKDCLTLVRGARKVWNGKLIDLASVMYTASAAAQNGKKAKTIMQNGLKDIIKEARLDI